MKAITSYQEPSGQVLLWVDGDELVIQFQERGSVEHVARLDGTETDDVRQMLEEARVEWLEVVAE
jgi:hypothetical protein